jgi:flagellar basal-body rod modification protein FlgD
MGAHRVIWDGRDGNGAAVPAGTYKIAVGAIDAEGKSVTTSTIVPGRVTGIETQNGEVTLVMGTTRVSVGDVTSARKPAASI